MKVMNIILLGLTFAIIVAMIPAMDDQYSKINDGVNSICYTSVCVRESIDSCDKVIDLGWESVGFLTKEHFYYCDGIKITNKCLEYKEVRDNRTGINFNMRCVEPKQEVKQDE